MKILFLSPLAVHPGVDNAGARIVFNLIDHLSRNNEVHLLCVTKNRGESDIVKQKMKDKCRKIFTYERPSGPLRKVIEALKYLFFYIHMPYDIVTVSYPGLYRLVRKVTKAENYDVVQIEYTSMMQYVKAVQGANTAKVLDEHDIGFMPLYRKWQSARNLVIKLQYMARWHMLREYELSVIKMFDMVLTMSEHDETVLLKDLPGLNVRVFRYGTTTRSIEASKGNNIMFYGNMGRIENSASVTYFVDKIYPIIKRSIPDIKFYVVGSSPKKGLGKLAGDKSIVVTGWVDDPTEYFKKCALSVAPMVYGGGVMTKIIDLMAVGRPVVTNSVGNEGIEALDGKEIVVRDDPEGFAKAVIDLLKDPAKRTAIGEAAKSFVERNHEIKGVFSEMENGLRQLKGGREKA